MGTRRFSADPELSDQGKQPKFVHVWEWPRPRESRAYEPVIGWANRGVVETGNGSDVPGVLQVREHARRLCTSQVSGR